MGFSFDFYSPHHHQRRRSHSRRRRSVKELGLSPSPEQVDEWLTSDIDLERFKVGESFQGRDLFVYHSKSRGTSTGSRNNKYRSWFPLPWPSYSSHNHHLEPQQQQPTVLFLSLEHGNEPLGLLSLLWTVEFLHSDDDNDDTNYLRRQKLHQKVEELTNPLLLFFPVVNVDAYRLNLEYGGGCRRTNLRNTCSNDTIQEAYKCPANSFGGVDLNRNFPVDWMGEYADDDEMGGPCGITFKGSEPFSEPETQAIREVVQEKFPNIQAALSFHTRGLKESEPLLIHPFTSSRPLRDNHRLEQYREWARELNKENLYITGSAKEAIHYTACGSLIDFLHSQGVMAFVLESRSPCDGRWCQNHPEDILHITQQDGRTGVKLAQLLVTSATTNNLMKSVLTDKRNEDNSYGNLTWSLASLFMVVLSAALLLSRRHRHHFRYLYHHMIQHKLKRFSHVQKSGPKLLSL